MIAFRVDINKQIASGHIMRCLTIAKKLREKNTEILFISGDDYCIPLLESNGFNYEITHTPHVEWDSELTLMKSIIIKYNIGVIFVDSYEVSGNYLKELNRICHVAYIDDYLKEKYDISLLLAPTQSRDVNIAKALYDGTPTKLLLGREYLIMRDEFLINKNKNYDKSGIFVATGGTDNLHFTLNFIKGVIQTPSLHNNHFFIILGSLNDDEEVIRELVKDYPFFEVMKNVNNISEYMHRSMYAIAAGGNTLYELLCCNVPVSCIALSDDQTPLGERLSSLRIISYEGDCRKDIFKVVSNCINSLESFLMNGLDNQMAEGIKNFTDGLGAERIARELILMDS